MRRLLAIPISDQLYFLEELDYHTFLFFFLEIKNRVREILHEKICGKPLSDQNQHLNVELPIRRFPRLKEATLDIFHDFLSQLKNGHSLQNTDINLANLVLDGLGRQVDDFLEMWHKF